MHDIACISFLILLCIDIADIWSFHFYEFLFFIYENIMTAEESTDASPAGGIGPDPQ